MAAARIGQAPLAQMAKDFGISEESLSNWLKRADIDRGRSEGSGAQVRMLRCANAVS